MRLHNSGTWRHSAYVPYRKWRTRKHGSRATRPTHIPMTVIWILRIQCIIPNHGYQSMIMTLSRQSLQSVSLKLLFFFDATSGAIDIWFAHLPYLMERSTFRWECNFVKLKHWTPCAQNTNTELCVHRTQTLNSVCTEHKHTLLTFNYLLQSAVHTSQSDP